jgi:spermidine/putrescine transport system permease protein
MLKQALVFLHLCSPDATLLYNPFTVLLVIIYTYLPFAILPVYAAAEKFDYSLIEAARDLGASQLRAFMRIFMPGISRGVWTAVLMVFIPALGSYVIPDIVGGPGSEMIGNKIAQRTFVDRNLPHASALSALLTLAVMVPLMISLVHHYRQPAVQKKGKGAHA